MTTVIDRYKEEIKSLNDEIENLKRIIHTRATPSADTLAGLVRYGQVMTRIMKVDNGEYVLYSEAAAVVAAKDADIKVVEGDFIRACNYAADVETRAEAAEAELAETKMLLQNERDQQVHEELVHVKAELSQIKAQEPVKGAALIDGQPALISRTKPLPKGATPLYAAPVSDSLKAENERLREALKKLACKQNWNHTDWIGDFNPMTIARAALKGDSNDKG